MKSVICLRFTQNTIRATGATLLSKHKYGFGDAQIMSVTGHKSVQSLITYQRIDTEDKMKMGQTLTDNLVPVSSSSNQAALPSTAMLALPSTPGIENRQTNMQVNPQIFYGNVTVIHNLTINK